MADLISSPTNARPLEWLAGVVLAGGESRRMGRPKAWLDAGGEPLLARTVRRVAAMCSEVVVVGGPGQDLPPVPAPIVRDAVAGEGPLRGLEAGMAAIRTRAAFVCAVDVPFLQIQFISFLAAHLEKFQAVVPRWGGREHPLQAVYTAETLPVIRKLLGEGNRRLADLFARLRVRYLEEDAIRKVDPRGAGFINANTAEEWEAILKRGFTFPESDQS